jgi:signal transduction histidine kinase
LAATLRARLQAVETRAGPVADFDCQDERLPPAYGQDLYRVVQEALNNVLKHAHAGRVCVRLAVANGHATLALAGDGVGFEPFLLGAHGFGLQGMREGAARLGGALNMEGSPGVEARIQVELPR